MRRQLANRAEKERARVKVPVRALFIPVVEKEKARVPGYKVAAQARDRPRVVLINIPEKENARELDKAALQTPLPAAQGRAADLINTPGKEKIEVQGRAVTPVVAREPMLCKAVISRREEREVQDIPASR
jgi:hypothetical protein